MSSNLSTQLNKELELMTIPEEVLGIRSAVNGEERNIDHMAEPATMECDMERV